MNVGWKGKIEGEREKNPELVGLHGNGPGNETHGAGDAGGVYGKRL